MAALDSHAILLFSTNSWMKDHLNCSRHPDHRAPVPVSVVCCDFGRVADFAIDDSVD